MAGVCFQPVVHVNVQFGSVCKATIFNAFCRASALNVFPIYVFFRSKKCFNPSAFCFFVLSVNAKWAEGFENQTFQHVSAVQGKPIGGVGKSIGGVGKPIGGVVGTIGANGFCVGPMKTRVQAKPRRGCKPSAQGKRAKRAAPWVQSRGVRCAPGGGKSSDRSVQIHRQRRVTFPM